MTFGAVLSALESGASNMTTDVCVPSERTAAMCEPSGDQVGNPYKPSEVSSRATRLPSGRITDSELSAARRAIRPAAPTGAIDRAGELELPGGLDDGLAEAPPAADEDSEGIGEGAGLPHAPTSSRTTDSAAPPVHLIVQRYARHRPVDRTMLAPS